MQILITISIIISLIVSSFFIFVVWASIVQNVKTQPVTVGVIFGALIITGLTGGVVTAGLVTAGLILSFFIFVVWASLVEAINMA